MCSQNAKQPNSVIFNRTQCIVLLTIYFILHISDRATVTYNIIVWFFFIILTHLLCLLVLLLDTFSHNFFAIAFLKQCPKSYSHKLPVIR